jgi:hypothetical protein
LRPSMDFINWHFFHLGLLLLFLMCDNRFYKILNDRFLIFIHCCHRRTNNTCYRRSVLYCQCNSNRCREKRFLSHRSRYIHLLPLKTNFSRYHAPLDHLILQEDSVSHFYKLRMSVMIIEMITFIWIANEMAIDYLGTSFLIFGLNLP